MVRVKICGMTNRKDAERAVSLGAGALGFIFYKKSPRFISPAAAKKIIAHLPPFVSVVGVFVNEKEAVVKRIASDCRLHALQFHGEESPGFCRKFKNYPVIKAFRVKEDFRVKTVQAYAVSGYLFDAYTSGLWGGSGQTFNWQIIAREKWPGPIILSGGLTPQNVSAAVEAVKPFAVDVVSGVEQSPGKKDPKRLHAFFKALGY